MEIHQLRKPKVDCHTCECVCAWCEEQSKHVTAAQQVGGEVVVVDC